jgi:cell division transport system permease protein
LDWGKVKFFLGEVLRSFTRNTLMQFTAIGTVAATVTLLGAFLFVRAALADLGNGVLQQIEISAYLDNNVNAHEMNVLHAYFKKDPHIAAVQFVPKTEGLKEMSARMHGIIDTSLLDENPLPDMYRIRVKLPEEAPAVAKDVRRLGGVANVVYGQTVVARLLQLGDVLRRIGLALIAVFLLVGAIIISNTTRLAVYARRREIAIMQLVGATNTYIRMPFICEGAIVGVTGALSAVSVLSIAHATVWPRIVSALPFVQFNIVAVNMPGLIVEMLLVGGIIGIFGAWVSVGRHLQT